MAKAVRRARAGLKTLSDNASPLVQAVSQPRYCVWCHVVWLGDRVGASRI